MLSMLQKEIEKKVEEKEEKLKGNKVEQVL